MGHKMVTKAFEVVSYQVKLGRKMTMGNGQSEFYAFIVCEGAKGERYNVYFLHPGSEGENFYKPGEDWAAAFVPAEHYLWYMDLLRNEKPVFAQVNSDTPEWNRLFTGSEPVGENDRGIMTPKIAPPTKKT